MEIECLDLKIMVENNSNRKKSVEVWSQNISLQFLWESNGNQRISYKIIKIPLKSKVKDIKANDILVNLYIFF